MPDLKAKSAIDSNNLQVQHQATNLQRRRLKQVSLLPIFQGISLAHEKVLVFML
jgi:hypothetical protein